MKIIKIIKSSLEKAFSIFSSFLFLVLFLLSQGTPFAIYYAIIGKASDAILSFIIPFYGIISVIGKLF